MLSRTTPYPRAAAAKQRSTRGNRRLFSENVLRDLSAPIVRLHNTALLAAITFGVPLLTLVMAVGSAFGSRLLGAAENEPAAGETSTSRRSPGGARC